jgi:hypothetical protein
MPRGGIRAYARYRGVDPMAVEKAIRSGRITPESDGKLDFEKTDREWSQNTTPKMEMPTAATVNGSAIGAAQYTRARAFREFYQAHLSKIQYEQSIGKLVPKEEVQAAAFNKYRRFRDQILSIPDRIAALLAAESDAKKCHELLDAELRRALYDSSSSTAGPD